MNWFARLSLSFKCIFGCLLAFILSLGQAAAATPVITSINVERTNIIVKVQVPEGLKQITLQSRDRFGTGGWKPRAVLRTDGLGGIQEFRLSITANLEFLRVQAEADSALPASFFKGQSTFNGPAASSQPVANFDSVATTAPTTDRSGEAAAAPGREVVESDIWKIRDDTLYFFNQYRGLQIVDVKNAASPVLRATYSIPASGEQMYVLGTNYVVLLVRDNCNWIGDGNGSGAVIIDVASSEPKEVARVGVLGYLSESRMVGNALYMGTQAYRPTPENTNVWEFGSVITSVDLTDPAKPVKKDTFWEKGYGNVMSATDRFLFVATGQDDWRTWTSRLRVIDISDPNGRMVPRSTITVNGRVPDKFKINLNGDILTVISQSWRDNTRWYTSLETFSLANPDAPVKLGNLKLAEGEQLHATRFDGNKVYIVTFFRIDPLWIVDLSNPAAPRIAGELEVPGWSTYIHPMGDRLISIGVDNGSNSWRVAVSLFDVSDSAKPALLSKVPLGENHSWSEANSDEKAFQVLTSAGLILVPYQGYSTNGYATKVQLIDFDRNSLRKRGEINHQMQPRRATLHQDHILSISGRELMSVDASNRDLPQLKSELELSWGVDDLVLAGDYLIQIDRGGQSYWWRETYGAKPVIRVSRKDSDKVEGLLVLTNELPIAGLSFKNGLLYLAQTTTSYDYPAILKTSTNDAATNQPNIFLTVVDATQLPSITLAGKTEAVIKPLGWSPALTAVWPKEDVVVWSGTVNYWRYYMWDVVAMPERAVGVVAAPMAVADRFWGPWWGGDGGNRFIAFDVKTSAAPKFASELELSTNSWNHSKPFAVNGLVYASEQKSEFIEGVTVPGVPPPSPWVTVDEKGNAITNFPPVGVWVQKYYLHVADYADARNPVRRIPVNIPGSLEGLSHNGSLLYTIGYHYTNDGEWLDASAYDGVSAFLVDSLRLPNSWPRDVLVSGADVFYSEPGANGNAGRLTRWKLSAETGKFAQTGALALPQSPYLLQPVGDVIIGSAYPNLLVIEPGADLRYIGKATPPSCYGYSVEKAVGSRAQGFWMPLNDYGVGKLTISGP